ncbi:NFATC2-interacting protein-like [Littorina saxatilis]|uniref:Rad60/SUMO-like domain-containing protein n=1 Tax=Littorina saxatilis TaxID=31220 RepID=A0AAN9AK73_9CAEN
MSSTTEEVAPPPPLKKRATKRGLSKAVKPDTDAAEEAGVKPHVTSVYSACVQRSSILSLTAAALPRIPLVSTQNNSDDTERLPVSGLSEPPRHSPRPKRLHIFKPPSLLTEPSTPSPTNFVVEDDALDEFENSILSTGDSDVSIYRSPSPPVPPPPPTASVRGRAKRVSKGIQKALKTLDSMKGELRRGVFSTPPTPTVVNIDSPVQRDTQVVRVRHMVDVHRFSMAKTDMFYRLQEQMASLLQVDVDQIGLYLNDCRLAPSDTPSSARLHVADIIVCHVMVPEEGGSGDASVSDSDSIRVRMQCRNSRQNSHMIVKKYLSFKVLFENYAASKEKGVECFQFHFDGETLQPDMLPDDVDLDDDDTIDVIELK